MEAINIERGQGENLVEKGLPTSEESPRYYTTYFSSLQEAWNYIFSTHMEQGQELCLDEINKL